MIKFLVHLFENNKLSKSVGLKNIVVADHYNMQITTY